MGSVVGLPVIMQFLIASSLFAAAASQLVVYPNGAVAPYDPNNAAATKEHFEALNEAGAAVNPYFTHAQDLAVPAPVVYAGLPLAGLYGRKKRSADPQVLGAAVPALPYAAAVYGRKKREADAQVLLAGAYPYAYGYAGVPYALPIAPLVAHPNGAVVPLEPADVVKARADHLAAVAEAVAA